MNGVWIYQKDKKSYMDIMNIECGSPEIVQEKEEKLQVNFCSAAMTVWVQAGMWYSFEE